MNITPISRLISYEFRRFKGLSALALAFILLIPALYGGIYLAANWNLYNHTDRLKVAVVNLDEGAEYKGESIHAGDMLEDAVKSQKRFDWQFLGKDSQAAHDGMKDGNYFMVMTVPKDFSEKLTSAGTLKAERAGITLERDDANGFIAGMLTSQIDNAITAVLDSSVSETYFSVLLGNLEEIRAGMADASEGSSSLHTHLVEVRDGVERLNSAVSAIDVSNLQSQMNSAPASFASFDAAMAGFDSAASKIEGGATQIVDAGQTMKTSATDIQSSLESASTFLSQNMTKLGGQLQSVGATVASVAGAGQESPAGKVTVGIKTAQGAASQLAAAYPDVANDPRFAAMLAALTQADENQATVNSGLADVGSTLSQVTIAHDAQGLKTSLEAIADADRKLADAGTGIVDGLTQIQEGGNDSRELVSGVTGQVSALRSSLESLSTQGSELSNGLAQLSNAVATLDEAMPQLVNGADQLTGGLASGAGQIPVIGDDERASLASVMSSPVDVTQIVDNSAKYYGRGLAPMFFSLGLWIATISTFLVVRTISGRALTSRGSTLRTALFGFGPVATVGIVGALVMGLGLWPLLGIDPIHPWLYILLLVVTAISFMGLAYAVRLGLGSPQTAIFLVALILQLPACGGTFPISMLSKFWQALGVISPMRYSVDAFRVAISGGSMATYWGAIAVLGAIAAVSLVLTFWLVRRRELFRMRDLHPPLATGPSAGENAFMVRPR